MGGGGVDDAVVQVFFLVLTVFLGLVFGSFATALAWRLPRGHSMVKRVRSACPSCDHPLGIPDLVPVFSWLFLRGRCRHCGAPIGWQYPAIELATLALCLGLFWRFGFSPALLAAYALAPVVVAIADIDIRYKIIPDVLNLSVAGTGAAALLLEARGAADPPDFIVSAGGHALLGAALYAATALLLRAVMMWRMKREPLGLGDVKFFAAAGIWLGASLETLSHFMMLAGFLGVAFALGWRKWRGEAMFPFGPALLAAFVILLFWRGPAFWSG